MTLHVRPISREEHLAVLVQRGSASFLQCPSWGEVKAEWRHESLGWQDATGELVGAALVLYRPVPVLRRYLAYLPEGPVIPWDLAVKDLQSWLDPLVDHLRRARSFGVKMGPPVPTRRWSAASLKAVVAAGGAARLTDVEPDAKCPDGETLTEALTALGWRPPARGTGFGAGQPRHVFQVPLAGRSEAELLSGFNQLWRRNVKKADKAGVEVTQGGAGDLPAFHAVYLETARRDGFTPRPLAYFARMWTALRAEDPDRIRLYLARHEGDLVAATTMVRVGSHVWYSYGASASAKREVRGSNAVQWRMMRDALAVGADVYDLRGISDTLDPEDPLFGLIGFKLGTGGEAVEYVGEWDLPLNRPLFRAVEHYLARR